ncbi:MAG TPA: DASS family sodium-coupled anion symporter [Casimicrobiaceae bacterium]|jgi:sodium-dependent dicarboxylate transporter 2/3/5|nr:DASS family sodium-coupled anion symporter [Casimicrobiaceae bacterium]
MTLQQKVGRIGLVAGPLLALALYLWLPGTYVDAAGKVVPLAHAARATFAMMVWMATWWMTEATEIEVTSLLPIVAFPLLGVMSLAATTASYGADVIYLFLGGFVLAMAIQRWGLDRRIAFLTLHLVGARTGAIVAGIMGATAFLSMWVSNTATAAMMVPIALSVIDLVLLRRTGRTLAEHGGIPQGDVDVRNLALSLLLGVAYASSIGGLGTIIGSPPNGIFVRFYEQTYGVEVSFAKWMLVGMPTMLLFLPLAWFLNTRVLFPTRLREIEGGRAWIRGERAKLGPLNRGEKATLVVFAFAVFFWVFRPLVSGLSIAGVAPFAKLSDAGIAVAAALALFLIPVDRAKGEKVIDWATAVKLPWGVLILFGGGLALAAATEANGVAQYIGSLARGFSGWPLLAVIVTVIALMVFMSELTSNTAQVATMLPILAALAPVLGVPPALLLLPTTIAASCAFMMPVGTPPNAIVFGTGLVRMPQMMKAGLWLNLSGILLITGITWFIIAPLLLGSR